MNKVKTTGQAEPVVLKADVKRSEDWVPVWSPSGEWILHADGQTIYGIGDVAAGDHGELFSMSLAKGVEKTIGSVGREYRPENQLHPAMRLSLAPDGKSVTYSTVKYTSNLWLMEGLDTVTAP